jgi:hypothetical protein
MATPNIVNVTSIYGGTAQVTPPTTATVSVAWTYQGVGTTTSATTALTGLTPATNSVQKIESIVVSNTTGSAVNATVALANNATFASSTLTTYLAYQVAVPANATLVVTDKSTSFYLGEGQSIGAISATGGALTFTASFETIT